MAEKLFDRAFNKVLSHQKRAEAKVEAERPLTLEQKQTEENERLRRDSRPMTSDDAVRRILLADKDKNYFRLLELAAPSVDALGRPSWSCTASDISTAFRKLSPLVHPDKNPDKDARTAFEALNRAKRLLSDPGTRDEILNQHLEAAKQRQADLESGATPEERQSNFANKRKEAQSLRKQEADNQALEILRQRQLLRDRAKRKREMQERASKRQDLDKTLSDGDDAEEDYKSKQKDQSLRSKRKGKPRCIF